MEDTTESFLIACEHLSSDLSTTRRPPLTCDKPLPHDPRDQILDTTMFESASVVPLASTSVSEFSRDPVLLRDDVPNGSCSAQPMPHATTRRDPVDPCLHRTIGSFATHRSHRTST